MGSGDGRGPAPDLIIAPQHLLWCAAPPPDWFMAPDAVMSSGLMCTVALYSPFTALLGISPLHRTMNPSTHRPINPASKEAEAVQCNTCSGATTVDVHRCGFSSAALHLKAPCWRTRAMPPVQAVTGSRRCSR